MNTVHLRNYLFSGFYATKALIREHFIIMSMLLLVSGYFFAFSVRLQALEPYAYAAGIEGYYDFSRLFALAAGKALPDFGRYHPNHPLGQALAGVVFDRFGISVLTWMYAINVVSALCAGYLIYVLCISLKLGKFKANLSAAIFFSTHFVALASLSGEWHMPAVALNIAGMHRLVCFFMHNKRRYLYQASILMVIGGCYHINAAFVLMYVGVVLLFVRPLWKYPVEMLTAFTIVSVPVIFVYLLIPMKLYNLTTGTKFLDFFLAYSKLNPTPYEGIGWILMAFKTLFHGFIFIFPGLQYLPIFVLVFSLIMVSVMVSFARSQILAPIRWLFLFLAVGWLLGPRLINSRPDALNGWLFILPYLSIMIVVGACNISKHLRIPLAIIAVMFFTWNFLHWTLPNHEKRSDEVFLLSAPALQDPKIPIGFVIYLPPFSFPEIWHAGSVLNLRFQETFFPCCGERGFNRRLLNWLHDNPKAIVVTDDHFEELEAFLNAKGLRPNRIVDRTADWPANLTPATVYIPLQAPLRLHKRIVAWRLESPR